MTNIKTPIIEVLDLPSGIRETDLKRFAAEVLNLGGRADAKLCLAFVSDHKIRVLNRDYRNIDQPTDVLSFSIAEETPEGDFHLGDIAISLPTAERQAKSLGHSLLTEVLFLVAHGVLHLCGFNHETDSGEMERMEAAVKRDILPLYC